MRNIIASQFSEFSAPAQNSNVMGEGHVDFLNLHTGLDPATGTQGRTIINPEGVMATALQVYNVSGWGWSDGTSYSGFQVEMIQGLFFMYRATGNEKYLDLFNLLLAGYRDVYYNGQPVPTVASIWRANYIVNSKRPFDLNGQTVGRNQPYEPLPAASAFPIVGGDSTNMGNYAYVDLEFADVLFEAYQTLGVREYQRMYNSVIYTAFDFISNLKDGNGGVNYQYMPGAAPGYLSLSPRLYRKDSWGSMPNMAYQNAAAMIRAGRVEEYTNVIAMWKASQNYYRTKSTVALDGPFTSIFLWNRPDKPSGTVGTFVMYVSQDQPRAFWAAARAWQVGIEQGLSGSLMDDLQDITERFAIFLHDFIINNPLGPWCPITFSAVFAPPTANNNEAGFAGLYLGAVMAMKFAGSTLPILDELISLLYAQIEARYSVLTYTHARADMSGSFTNASGSGTQLSYWSAAIMRALGMLIQWETRNNPAFIRPIGKARFLLEADDESFVRAENNSGVILKEESENEG